MTIERDHYNGPIAFRCDAPKCHEFEETHCQEFGGAHAKAKAHGWTTRKVGDEWQHLCPGCSS